MNTPTLEEQKPIERIVTPLAHNQYNAIPKINEIIEVVNKLVERQATQNIEKPTTDNLTEQLIKNAREYIKQFRSSEDNYITIDDITAFHWINTLIKDTVKAVREEVSKKIHLIMQSPAGIDLLTQWGQLDEDGICIAVSRQALEETIKALEALTPNQNNHEKHHNY